MNAPTLIQEAIEQRASEKLEKDIDALRGDLRDVLHKHNHISAGVNISINSDDGAKSRPYLSQILDCEAVNAAIRKQHLEKYIKIEIQRLLNKADA